MVNASVIKADLLSAIALAVATIASPATSHSFATSNVAVLRAMGQTTLPVDATTTASLTVTNHEAEALRGFYVTEHIPDGLALTTTRIEVNGVEVTSATLEITALGAVYQAHRSYRWVIETPSLFTEANPIVSGATCRVVYTINATRPGVFDLDQLSWAGYYEQSATPAFGHSEEADKTRLIFTHAAAAVRAWRIY